MITVKVPKGAKVYVLGDLHEHPEALRKALKEIKPGPTRLIASVGDLYDKGWGRETAEEMADTWRELVNRRVGFIIRGNHELKHIRRAQRAGKKLTSQLQWLQSQPLAVCFEFVNRSRLLVVHGGVTPKHTWEKIGRDIDICYVRDLDDRGKAIPLIREKDEDGITRMRPKSVGKSWHHSYDGRFGYIASGHEAQKDGVPKFYNFSCNLDSAIYHTGKLSVQTFSEMGKEELLTFVCKPKYPDLDEMFALMQKRRI